MIHYDRYRSLYNDRTYTNENDFSVNRFCLTETIIDEL